MSRPETPKRPETAKPVAGEGLNSFPYEIASIREPVSWCHPSDCEFRWKWPYFQAMLISTSSQKRREAIERRMVIEDVVK